MTPALLWDVPYDIPDPPRRECPNCGVPVHSVLDRCSLCDGEPIGYRNRKVYTISLGDLHFEVK